MGDKDLIFMSEAYELAKTSIGRTAPNPLVGCVIVKDDRIIGSGFHKKSGMPHAEIEALNSVKNELLKDAVMYITLEPCCHENKKTPPCTAAIIKSGIKKVVVGSVDPNPEVNQQGIIALEKNKVEVKLLDDIELVEKIVKLNECYNKFIKTKKPFVVLKAAITLDGKIATYTGESQWISNQATREYAHQLRNIYDAVLVSSNTILADNPLLTCRIKGNVKEDKDNRNKDNKNIDYDKNNADKQKDSKNPIRIIVDTAFKVSLDSNVFKDGNFIVATTKKADIKKINAAVKKGGKVIVVSDDRNSNNKNSSNNIQRVNLKELFKKLAEQNITSVLVEGGNKLAASLLLQKLVDKCVYFIAPVLLGNDGKPAIAELGIIHLKDAIHLKNTSIKVLDNNVIVEGYL